MRTACLCCLLAWGTSAGWAQPTDTEDETGSPASRMGPPSNFVPPPPPSFTPPSAPPQLPPSASQQDRTVQRPTPSEAELLERPSDLVDADDPEMDQVVGMIRIPEMGTNEVIEMLENFTGKPILRQQTLPSVKITFFSQGPMTRARAITAIESLLALNGIAITGLGEDFLKAVPSAVINQQIARPWEGSTLGATPSQTLYEKIFELDFLSAEEATQLLQPLMTQGAPLAFDKSGLILITDSLINLQRIERLLPTLDKPARLKTEMLFFNLQNIGAEEVSQRFQQLIAGPLRRQLEGNTTVEADERTNQVIIFTHPTNSQLIRDLIERLDIDVAPATDTKIYSIRYADATEVVDIIDQIVSGQREVRQDATGSGGPQNPAAAVAARERAQQIRQSNEAAAAARAEATNLQFSDFLTIVPDERANTIVANGTHNDLRYLTQLIDQIDTLLAQVRIEVIIAEVNLREDDARGIDTFGFSYTGTGFEVDLEGSGSSWTASPGNLYGIGFGDGVSWGPDEAFSFSVLLNRIATHDNAVILSAPTIVTTHNKEATVSVGQERPVITSTTSSVTTGTDVVDRQQVQYRDIKLELKVTPLIGIDGIVQLEVEQIVQSIIGEVEVNDNAQPIVGTSSANSYVSVRDGGLVVLGGLQKLDETNNFGKMAVLGRIPVVGNLFSRKTENRVRQELLIFIKPTIIRDSEDANTDAVEQINILEDSDDIRGYLDRGTFRKEKEETTPAGSADKATPRRFQP